jgi:hypothetical protein
VVIQEHPSCARQESASSRDSHDSAVPPQAETVAQVPP